MNRMMKRRFGFNGIAALTVFLALVLMPFSAGAMDVLIGTGPAGTFSHFAGRTLCRTLDLRVGGVDCRVVPAPGDVHNLTNLRIGSLDMALIDSRMLHDAIRQTGYFRFLDIRYDNLKTIAALYDLPIVLLVRSDARIDSLDAAKGKRINAGAPRSLEHLAFDEILAAKRWSIEDFRLVEELSSSQSLDTMAFCHGTIQAMLHIGVHPNDALRQLLRLCDARFCNLYDADIQQLVEKHPAFFPIVIPADTYPPQQEPVSTFGTRVVLIASGDLGEQTVYRIAEAMHDHRQRLKAAHPALTPFAGDEPPTEAFGLFPHPGVLRYFAEKGS
jgi:TRAP transporter TAXI family solute receptor